MIAAKDHHVLFAFDAILNSLHGQSPPSPSFEEASTALFVTWKTIQGPSDHPRLRGCIGILEPRQLTSALHDYALSSAFRDSRFSPIGLHEVPKLQCTISLISCFEKDKRWDEWEVGRHGIIIEFLAGDERGQAQRRFSATFLPEVAPEQGWGVEETVDALVRKSGFNGKVDGELKRGIRLTRYQSSTRTMSYQEYIIAKGV